MVKSYHGGCLKERQTRSYEKIYRGFGRDSLLLATLAYNVGAARLLGYGKIPQSRLVSKLKRGDRNIYKEYVTFRCWNGKVIPSIELRRKVEFLLLYEQ